MAAMHVLKAGARRRIGNGQDTRVWKIPWLPSVDNGCLTSVMPAQLKDITVNSLMKDTGREWDVDVIEDLFNRRDADLIKRVPIPMSDKMDDWFWLLDEKGVFTVRSGYRWMQGEFENDNKWFWNKLWSLQLPGKIAHFLWHVCMGCLPTAYALAVKKVVENAQCPWCRREVETDAHVLFACDFARSVWFSAGLQHIVQFSQSEPAFMVIRRIFEACTKEQCVHVSTISWCIWYRRNKWVWDKCNGSDCGVKVTTMNLLAEWK